MRKRRLFPSYFALLILLSLALPVFGQTDSVAVNSPDNETPQAWFVELSSPPAADGTSLATLRAEKAAFRAAAKSAALAFTERRSFDTLWNGLSIDIAPAQVSKLTSIPGVKNIYPVLPFVYEPGNPVNLPDISNAITMTGADYVQNTLGFTGKGVKAGVIDTGIDYLHPDLGGCFGPGCRVVAGYDFVGDAYTGYNTPVPDNDPMDCAGHGTHVSGIIGANGAIKGVAPDVTFYAYRVFGCSGVTQSDIMIAALERALADHVDVVNMSIGASFQGWPEYPTAQASDRLVNKGVVVVASIGNNGANGLYSAGAPGVGKKVIGVASVDNIKTSALSFSLPTSPGPTLVGYNPAAAAPPPPVSGTADVVKVTPVTGCSTPDVTVNPFAPGSLAGKIALIQRGTPAGATASCGFYQKALNAQQAGAAGVILYNNVAGALNPTVAGAIPITIPVVAITLADGNLISGMLPNAFTSSVTITWTTNRVSTPNPTGDLVSSFSSYGLTYELGLKPDIAAPGGMIFSTYPRALGSYTSMSGTSMASPHIAGTVALLLQAQPKTPSQVVGTILQNSAIPKLWWGNPSLGLLDNVHRQGAGLVNIANAVQATTRIEPGDLALGDSQAGPVTRTLTITNNGEAELTYDLSAVSALATGPNTFTPTFASATNAVTFSSSSVTVAAGASATVDVTIAPGGFTPKSLYGGYIVVTPQGGSSVYRVPYAGFVGDYQSIVVLAPTAYGFPWLATYNGTSYIKQPTGATYTMVGNNIPYFLVHFDHGVQVFRMTVVDANTGQSWHWADNERYLGRNSGANSFFAIPWDGTTFAGKKIYSLPNGQYTLTISVLKALGDDNNPADWETWTSPTITIARP